jgi:hypothetical protein
MTAYIAKYFEPKVSNKVTGGRVGGLVNDNGRVEGEDRPRGPTLFYKNLQTTIEKRDHRRDDEEGSTTLMPKYRGNNYIISENRDSYFTTRVQGFTAGPGGDLPRIIDTPHHYPETIVKKNLYGGNIISVKQPRSPCPKAYRQKDPK